MVDGPKLTGELLDARFRVEAPIGNGRFGDVLHGRDESRDTPCVVRVLRLPEGRLDAEVARTRLRENLRTWAKVAARAAAASSAGNASSSPRLGSARVFGFALPDAEAQNDGSVSYVASEWIEGETLESELVRRRSRGLTGAAATEVVDKLDVMVESLAAIHAAGGVHGALHPRAIRLMTRGRLQYAVLIDGGVEAALRAPATEYDVQTDIYQAPEQLSTVLGEVGPRADVYALALLILELLADHAPIDAPTEETLQRIALDPLERPTPAVLGIELGPVASDVLARATSLEPMARFDDAGTFWGTFKAALQRDLVHPARVRSRSSAPPSPDGSFADVHLSGSMASARPASPSQSMAPSPAMAPASSRQPPISGPPASRGPVSKPPVSRPPVSRPPLSQSPSSASAEPASQRPASQRPASQRPASQRPSSGRQPISESQAPTALRVQVPAAALPLLTEPMEAFRLPSAAGKAAPPAPPSAEDALSAADTVATAPLSSSSSLEILNAVEPPPRESQRDTSMDTPLALPPVFTGSPQAFANSSSQQSTFVRPENRGLRVADPHNARGSSVATYVGAAIGVGVGVVLLARLLFGPSTPAPPPIAPAATVAVDAATSGSAAASSAPPDPYDFERALAALDPRLANCKQAVGPTGVGSLHATFDPTGAVTDVVLDPPYAGTSRGGCIAGLFRTARGPLYKGPAHDTPHKFFVP